jgi:hypothetical protein
MIFNMKSFVSHMEETQHELDGEGGTEGSIGMSEETVASEWRITGDQELHYFCFSANIIV